jgi:hypothetical protein
MLASNSCLVQKNKKYSEIRRNGFFSGQIGRHFSANGACY